MKRIPAGIAEASSSSASRLRSLFTRVSNTLSHMKSSEVAEALIATWCIEFLRVRKVGGFNVVQIVAISALMMGVKAIVMEASRRRYSDQNRTFVVSRRHAPMDPVARRQYPPHSDGRPRRYYYD